MTSPAYRGSTYSASIVETVVGQLPATPNFTYLGATDNTLDFDQDSSVDPRVHADGQARFVAYGNQKLAGDLTGPIVFGMWDHYKESALQGKITSKVLKIGTQNTTMSVERGYTNANQFHLMKGVQVDKMEVTAGLTGEAEIKFSCVYRSFTQSGTTNSASAITDTVTLQPMKSQGGYFKIGGATNAFVQSVQLTTDRGLAGVFGFGNPAPIDYASTSISVTGQVTVLFTDDTQLAKYRSGTTDTLEFQIADNSGNTYTYHMGSVYYTAAPTSMGSSAAVPITLSFTAVYNAADASALVITTS